MGRLILVLAVLLAWGCRIADEAALREEMARIAPNGARRQGDCERASGFVENAPPSLRCRFLMQGAVRNVIGALERKLRNAGLRVQTRPAGGPSARLVHGQSDHYAVAIALIGEQRFLFFQVRRSVVPVGSTGIDVLITRKN